MRPRCSPPGDVRHDDPWTLLYTSGTTGHPKGAITTHGTAFFSSVNAIQKIGITSQSHGLTFMPLFHAGGLYMFPLALFHFGAPTTVMRSFDAATALQLLSDRALGISHLLGVPTQFIMMSELPEFADADFSHVQAVTIGGAAAPVPLLEKYLRKGIVLQQGWGMTETAAMTTVLSKAMAQVKIGSCGKPVLHTQLRVVDEGRQRRARRRHRRTAGEGPARHARLLEPPRGDAALVQRRLAAHRRRGAHRRGRLPVRGGPAEGHVHLRR